MDTSETSVKMCEKAVEIQSSPRKHDPTSDIAFRRGKEGLEVYQYDCNSFYWLENYGDGSLCKQYVISYWESDYPEYLGNTGIWLLRQDQLQEMVKAENNFNLTKAFRDWQIEKVNINDLLQWSMEQLWLAFVMHEKYDKVWNGEDWIKEVTG